MRTLITVLTGTILCSTPVWAPAWANDTPLHQLTLSLPAVPHWKSQTAIDTHKEQFGQVSDTSEVFVYDNQATPRPDGFDVTRKLRRQDLKISGMDISTMMLGDRQKAYRRELGRAIGDITYTTDRHLSPQAIVDWDSVRTKMRTIAITYMGDMGLRTFEATIGQSTPEAASDSYLSTQAGLDTLYLNPLQLDVPVTSETTLPAVLMNTRLKASQTLTLTKWETFTDKAEYQLEIKPDPDALKSMMQAFVEHRVLQFAPLTDEPSAPEPSSAEKQQGMDQFMAASQFAMSTTCHITASIRTGMVVKDLCDTQVHIILPTTGDGSHPGMKISNDTKVSLTQTLLP